MILTAACLALVKEASVSIPSDPTQSPAMKSPGICFTTGSGLAFSAQHTMRNCQSRQEALINNKLFPPWLQTTDELF